MSTKQLQARVEKLERKLIPPKETELARLIREIAEQGSHVPLHLQGKESTPA